MRDELRDITYNIDIVVLNYQNNILSIIFGAPELKEGQSFEITINEDDVLLYRGKAFATAQTDLENFELNKGVLKV